MSQVNKRDILLESGTNEVEIAEFRLGKQSFGINVAKIREFVPYHSESITKVPSSPPSMLGVFLLRGRTVPVVDLNAHLGRTEPLESDRPVVLVTEFNSMINGFVIDSINMIHRLSWNDLNPLNPVLKKHTTRFIGTVNIKDTEILILDLEYIISEIFPNKMQKEINIDQYITANDLKKYNREDIHIVIAEDSKMIRKLIVDTVMKAGYKHIKTYDNGKDAFNYIESLHNKAINENTHITKYVNVVVTDIEMPKMDGLTFCKSIKHEMKCQDVIVIMFSSLINEQMINKCRTVGADGYITKPQVGDMVQLIETLLDKMHS